MERNFSNALYLEADSTNLMRFSCFALSNIFFLGEVVLPKTGCAIDLAGKGTLLYTKSFYYSCLKVGEDRIW